MDALLKPDIGLIFWTIVNFVILAFLLAKFAWKPLISAIEAREKKIADDISSAERANLEAKKIKEDLKAEFEKSSQKAAEKLDEATRMATAQKDLIIKEANDEAEKIINKAKQEIAVQTEQALKEIKKDIADTAILALKKVISKEADEKTNENMANELLQELKK